MIDQDQGARGADGVIAQTGAGIPDEAVEPGELGPAERLEQSVAERQAEDDSNALAKMDPTTDVPEGP